MNFFGFIKRLHIFDVIWGIKTKKIAGVNDGSSYLDVYATVDGVENSVDVGTVPEYLRPGTYFRLFGGPDDGSLFEIDRVLGSKIFTVESLQSYAGNVTLDARMWVVHDDKDISRQSANGGTKFNLDNFSDTGRDDGSGIACAYATHYHDREPWVECEEPVGLKNNDNLEFYLPGGKRFVEGTLRVYLSGLRMVDCPASSRRDIEPMSDRTGFIFLLEPNDRNRLNCPPQQDEPLTVSYLLDV